MLRIFFILIAIVTLSCQKSSPLFKKLSVTDTNISFQNTIKNTAQLNILNYLYFYNGAGVAAGDFNNDSLVDLYFVANQAEDKLYLNNGNLQFDEIVLKTSTPTPKKWATGVTTVDINNDGLLDIYICMVGEYSNSKNILYVNKGVENGIPKFENEAAKYGLDIRGYSTQAVFFDYDLDLDLDMFLLNHSVHPNRTYGNGSIRETYDAESGDKIFENIDGYFVDVTKNKGIFQGKTGYGLGLSISDINNDGYPDIYVGNDFFENDYLYINQQDKTFIDIISTNSTALGHSSHFSMGNAIADINNDGNTDILSLDMLPDDLHIYKISGLEFPYPTYEQYLKNGYSPQYMQNTLHVNNGNNTFSEIAFMSGIAATEWSWNPLIADFDNDGFKDIYITNGILGATNDMDFINFISNDKIQKSIDKGLEENDFHLFEEIPERKATNYFYNNNGDNTFKDATSQWTNPEESFSNGAVYVDLDNDGDLDVVVNNVNQEAYILENTSNSTSANNFIKINFKGPIENRNGIGSKVLVYQHGRPILYENYTTRGYLSSVEPKLNIGIGTEKTIDSLVVIWTNGFHQTINNLNTNQEITLDFSEANQSNYYSKIISPRQQFLANATSPINFTHKDTYTLDFNKNPLIPFAMSNVGPCISIADINNDTLDDIFITGGKTQASELFLQQTDASFVSSQNDLFKRDALSEDTNSLFFNANGDSYLDLLIVSGGNEFTEGKSLNPRLYLNDNGVFIKDEVAFKDVETNGSTVKTVDLDNDGDLDISITSNTVSNAFGKTPEQYLFLNDGHGNFKNVTSEFAQEFQFLGNVTDVVWKDIDFNGFDDLIVSGLWMPITVFLNDGKSLKLEKMEGLQGTNGWWNTIIVEDFDKDGDFDMVAGNWGLNTRLKANLEMPITLYNYDFDDNGSEESIVTYFYKGEETPFSTKDELAKQMPFINKKYLSYNAFAKASIKEILPVNKLENASKKMCYELATCYFENLGNNNYKKHQLPINSQISSVNAIYADDFNGDGFLDLLYAGNNYEINTQLGRLDASHGGVLLNNMKGNFIPQNNPTFNISGPARSINKIAINSKMYYIIGINNNTPIFLNKNE